MSPRFKVLTVRASLIASILLLVSVPILAQEVAQAVGKSDVWTFQHYPAVADFRGKPAKPTLVTPLEHEYRTTIRAQARKGPNFAGHFTLVEWGCGTTCIQFVIVNANSGVVYDPGVVVGCENKDGSDARIDLKLKSRLIAATGSSGIALSSKEVECGTDYYLWDGKRLAHLHFEPWPKSGGP